MTVLRRSRVGERQIGVVRTHRITAKRVSIWQHINPGLGIPSVVVGIETVGDHQPRQA